MGKHIPNMTMLVTVRMLTGVLMLVATRLFMDVITVLEAIAPITATTHYIFQIRIA
ncbi:MAG TPA: hypothetical protein VKV19_16465 [Ktedonobacteraceae bacterium]|nr:hypothetical protein [Ktedonobacteraceae bacterium]